MMDEFIQTIILIVIIVVIIKIRSKSEKASHWTGEVIRKQDLSDEDDENHVFRLFFKADNGKTKKVTVSEEMYRKAKVGEKYEKLPGTYIPKKI